MQTRRVALPIVDITEKTPLPAIQQLHVIKNDLELLQRRMKKVKAETTNLAVRHSGAAATSFSSFPTPEMTKVTLLMNGSIHTGLVHTRGDKTSAAWQNCHSQQGAGWQVNTKKVGDEP